MPCKSGDLHVLAYAWGFTLWRCSATAPSVEILAEGYFNDASNMVKVGDQIIIGATDRAGINLFVSYVEDGYVHVTE